MPRHCGGATGPWGQLGPGAGRPEACHHALPADTPTQTGLPPADREGAGASSLARSRCAQPAGVGGPGKAEFRWTGRSRSWASPRASPLTRSTVTTRLPPTPRPQCGRGRPGACLRLRLRGCVTPRVGGLRSGGVVTVTVESRAVANSLCPSRLFYQGFRSLHFRGNSTHFLNSFPL